LWNLPEKIREKKLACFDKAGIFQRGGRAGGENQAAVGGRFHYLAAARRLFRGGRARSKISPHSSAIASVTCPSISKEKIPLAKRKKGKAFALYPEERSGGGRGGKPACPAYAVEGLTQAGGVRSLRLGHEKKGGFD